MVKSEPICSVTQWVRSAVPTFEPVSLAEARAQCNLGDNSGFDSILLDLIATARETVEIDTGIVAATGTYTQKLTEWPSGGKLELRGIRPVSSITSLVYIATDGTSTTWSSSNYTLDASAVVPAVNLAWNVAWPALRGDTNGITVTLVAGYATAAAVPAMFKRACLLLISHWFENRGIVTIGTIAPELSMAYESLVSKLGRATYP